MIVDGVFSVVRCSGTPGLIWLPGCAADTVVILAAVVGVVGVRVFVGVVGVVSVVSVVGDVGVVPPQARRCNSIARLGLSSFQCTLLHGVHAGFGRPGSRCNLRFNRTRLND